MEAVKVVVEMVVIVHVNQDAKVIVMAMVLPVPTENLVQDAQVIVQQFVNLGLVKQIVHQAVRITVDHEHMVIVDQIVLFCVVVLLVDVVSVMVLAQKYVAKVLAQMNVKEDVEIHV